MTARVTLTETRRVPAVVELTFPLEDGRDYTITIRCTDDDEQDVMLALGRCAYLINLGLIAEQG